MTILNYHAHECNFEIDTSEITAVVGSTALENVFLDLATHAKVHFGATTLGAISLKAQENQLLTLGDVISHQFKVHKKVSRKRSIQALQEILNFLNAEDIVNLHMSALNELQRAHARLARAIALRPELVISWNHLSSMSAPVRATICRNISDIHSEFNIGFLLLEKRLGVVQGMAGTIINFHPTKVRSERPQPPIEPLIVASAKSSPDEISGLDFVSS